MLPFVSLLQHVKLVRFPEVVVENAASSSRCESILGELASFPDVFPASLAETYILLTPFRWGSCHSLSQSLDSALAVMPAQSAQTTR